MMGNGYGDQGWTMGSMGLGGWLMMGVALFLCVALLVALVVWLSRAVDLGPRRMEPSTAPPLAAPAPSARATLDARFAGGDIDEVEYRRRLSVLQGGPPV